MARRFRLVLGRWTIMEDWTPKPPFMAEQLPTDVKFITINIAYIWPWTGSLMHSTVLCNFIFTTTAEESCWIVPSMCYVLRLLQSVMKLTFDLLVVVNSVLDYFLVSSYNPDIVKSIVIIAKALAAPQVFARQVRLQVPNHNIWYLHRTCIISRLKSKTGERAFSYAEPRLWNDLP